MSGPASGYRREDWFGPESFAAVLVGVFLMSLPYVGLAPRGAVWLIVGPPLTGVVLIVLCSARILARTALRRIGTGLLAAGIGAIISIPALLAGSALGSIIVCDGDGDRSTSIDDGWWCPPQVMWKMEE